ncbi:MAG: efflux transporter outer membrane subunit [Gammaproteobacteria bacterium]
MQAPSRSLILVVVTGTLAACGVTPSQEQVERDVDQAAQQQVPETPTQWQMASESGEVQAGWIESFNDPELTTLVIEAQSNNRDLAAAAANVDRAWALARRAGASLSPSVGLTGGVARTGSPSGSVPTSSNLTLGAQVSWEADVWGRLRSGRSAAVAGAQAVEADFRYAQESLAAATAKAYFTAIEANIQSEIARDTVWILEETQRIVNVQYENGTASAQDIALARSDLASARERLTTVENSYRDAVRALEVLIGRYPGAALELRETLPAVPPPPPAGLPSELLERRPDLIAADRRVAAAFNATNQARAARLPTLSLTANTSAASSSLSSLLDSSNVAWTAGTSLLAPIFDGGTLRENVNIATAEQEQALAAYGQSAINAFRELETSLDQGVVVQQRIVDLREAANEAAEAFRIARLRYEEGEEDLLNVLTIQQRGISSRSSLSIAERLLLEQRLNLNLALGGSWEN